MTAYVNLRNVLANMFAANYYTTDDDNVVFGLLDSFMDARYAMEDYVLDTCRTTKDYENWDVRFFSYLEKAAWTASHNEDFVKAVVNDVRHMWCD